jgi:hypothetical protein
MWNIDRSEQANESDLAAVPEWLRFVQLALKVIYGDRQEN